MVLFPISALPATPNGLLRPKVSFLVLLSRSSMRPTLTIWHTKLIFSLFKSSLPKSWREEVIKRADELPLSNYRITSSKSKFRFTDMIRKSSLHPIFLGHSKKVLTVAPRWPCRPLSLHYTEVTALVNINSMSGSYWESLANMGHQQTGSQRPHNMAE